MAINENGTLFQRAKDELAHLRDETHFPYTAAYAIGSAAIALTTKHYEALILTVHGIVESAREL